jgi:hypothetical protein
MSAVVGDAGGCLLTTEILATAARQPAKWGMGNHIWRRWVLANGWGELVGLGGSAVAVWLILAAIPGEPTPTTIVAGSAILIAISTVIEGGTVGLAQWLVLRRVLDGLRARDWLGATMLGALTAWLLAIIPITAMSLREAGADAAPADLPVLAVLGLALLLGAVLGPVLALFQWRVLRHHLPAAWWWMPAHSVAWAAGMVAIFAGAGAVPEGAGILVIAVTMAITCLAAGTVVGAIHGLVLVRLLRLRAGIGGALQECASPSVMGAAPNGGLFHGDSIG